MPSLAFPAKNCGAKSAANTRRNVNEPRSKRFQKYRGTRPSEREMAPVFRGGLDSVYVRRCCCLRSDLNQTLNLYSLLGQRLFLPIFFDLHYILRSLFVFASIRIRHLESECPKITPHSTKNLSTTTSMLGRIPVSSETPSVAVNIHHKKGS